jgi:hypothetical protein
MMLSQECVAVAAVVVGVLQRRAAEGDEAEWPAPKIRIQRSVSGLFTQSDIWRDVVRRDTQK